MGKNYSLTQPGNGTLEGSSSTESQSLPQTSPSQQLQQPASTSERLFARTVGHPVELNIDPRQRPTLATTIAHSQRLQEVFYQGRQRRMTNEATGPVTGTEIQGTAHFSLGPEGQPLQSNEIRSGISRNTQVLSALNQRPRRQREQPRRRSRRIEQRRSSAAAQAINTNTPESSSTNERSEPTLMQLLLAAVRALLRQAEHQRQRLPNATVPQTAPFATLTPPNHQPLTLNEIHSMFQRTANGSESPRPPTDSTTAQDTDMNDNRNRGFHEPLNHFFPGLDRIRSFTDGAMGVFRLDNHAEAATGAGNTTTTSNNVPSSPTNLPETSTAAPAFTSPPGSTIPVIIVGIRSLAQASTRAAQRPPGGHSNTGTSVPPASTPRTATATESQAQNATTPNASATGARLPQSRPWLIYAVGGNYPANHPILRMSGLNLSENATYEDLIRLSELIGPARPRNVTQAEIDAADLKVYTLSAKDLVGLQNATDLDTSTPNIGSNKYTLSAQVNAAVPSTNTAANLSAPKTRKRRRGCPSSPGTDLTTPIRCRRRRRVSKKENQLTGDQCTICLSPWAISDSVRVLHCQHSFHLGCVDRWLKEGSNCCPVCRATVVQRLGKNTKESVESSTGESIAVAGQ